MGISEEDDVAWARLMNATLGANDPDLNPDGIEGAIAKEVPEIFARCGKMIAERREHPTEDLTSVLVHAEIDGERLEEHEIVMGFFLLVAAGNDSTKATYCSGMRALMEDPSQRRQLLEDPSLIPSAVEESLRMFPAFAHFRRTATCDTEVGGQPIKEGEKVMMWYASSNRDETRYENPDFFDVTPKPRASGLRRGRAALLPGHGTRADGAADPARGDAEALPRDGDGRAARVRAVALPQPAEDAAGAAAGASRPLPSGCGSQLWFRVDGGFIWFPVRRPQYAVDSRLSTGSPASSASGCRPTMERGR